MKKKIHLVMIIISCVIVVGGVGLYAFFSPRLYERRQCIMTLKSGNSAQRTVIGSYKMRVNRYLNKETTVKYMVPVDQSGDVLKSASNVVFYAPYNGESGGNVDKINWIVPFVTEFGFSVFSLSIRADTTIVNDRDKYYIYPEAGWYEIIEEIQHRLVREFALESRPLIAVGQSSGGSLIQQMLVTKPEWINIAAWCGGSRYQPWRQANRSAILALNTWGCYGTESTDAMAHELNRLNGKLLHGYSPPLKQSDTHSVGLICQRLIQLFVRDWVDWRTPRHNQLLSTVEGYEHLSEEFNALWRTLPVISSGK